MDAATATALAVVLKILYPVFVCALRSFFVVGFYATVMPNILNFVKKARFVGIFQISIDFFFKENLFISGFLRNFTCRTLY